MTHDETAGDPHPPRPRGTRRPGLSLALGLLLLLSALPYLALFLSAMGTTSLTVDELMSITRFSARGPAAVLTDYSRPNNHILFNLLSSLTLGDEPLRPIRSRAWSFVFFLGALSAGTAFFFRRRLYVEGGLFFHLAAVNFGLLDLMLQARGYGLLFLAATLLAILLPTITRRRSRRPLFLFALIAVLGAWSVPVFLLFSGPLFLLTLLFFRRRDLAAAFAGAAAGSLLLYLPHLPRAIAMMRDFGHHYMFQYSSLDAVGKTFSVYLLGERLSGGAAARFLLLTGAPLLAGLALGRRKGMEKSAAIVLLALLAFLLLCLALGTTPVRTTAFVIGPFTIAILILAGAAVRRLRWRKATALLAALLALGLAARGAVSARTFRFVPRHDLEETARSIGALFPDGTPVFALFRSGLLSAYLGDRFPLRAAYDPSLYRAGRLICVAGPGEREAPWGAGAPAAKGASIPIPQREGPVLIYAGPGQRGAILSARGEEQGEARREKRDRLRIRLAGGRAYRSLFLRIDPHAPFRPAAVRVRERAWHDVAPEKIHRWGGLLVFELGDRPVEEIVIERIAGAGRPLTPPADLWIYPARLIGDERSEEGSAPHSPRP